MIARATHFVWRITYARYLVASALSLATDLCLFMLLLASGMAPVAASAIGYTAGLFMHWLISSRLVFSRQPTPFISRRRRQKLLFVMSAVIGLTLTSAVVGIGSMLGLDPRIAKLIAIALSFQTTYLLRRNVVFA